MVRNSVVEFGELDRSLVDIYGRVKMAMCVNVAASSSLKFHDVRRCLLLFVLFALNTKACTTYDRLTLINTGKAQLSAADLETIAA